MDFISDALSAYCQSHTSPESEVLKNLNRYTQSHVLMPRMLSGHFQGRALSLLSKMMQPKYILEVGTYTGYSAICLAEGLQPGGKLVSIDNNEELFQVANKYIIQAGMQDRIELVTGEASQRIADCNYPWDLIFLDADKEKYSLYFDLLIERLKPGGVIIADNVLWSGKVADALHLEKDKQTRTIHEFNQKIQEDARVENILLPVRDGLMLIRKKNA